MSDQPPASGLSLPYLIDALAQVEEATTRRARQHDEGEHQLAVDADAEGKPADYDSGASRWPSERAEWHRAIAPLRSLTSEVLERELGQLTSGMSGEALPTSTRVLPVLVAAARLRAGATVDVDTLFGR